MKAGKRKLIWIVSIILFCGVVAGWQFELRLRRFMIYAPYCNALSWYNFKHGTLPGTLEPVEALYNAAGWSPIPDNGYPSPVYRPMVGLRPGLYLAIIEPKDGILTWDSLVVYSDPDGSLPRVSLIPFWKLQQAIKEDDALRSAATQPATAPSSGPVAEVIDESSARTDESALSAKARGTWSGF